MNIILAAANPLAPNLGLIIWMTVVFLLLLFVMRRFAWRPITTALEDREKTIDESIQRAEKALSEAKQIQADNQKARREAEQEGQRIRKEAHEEAEALKAADVQATREKIQQMQEQAQADIQREKEGALNELRAEVANLAISAAEKILKENLDAPRQHRLVENFLDDLPKN